MRKQHIVNLNVEQRESLLNLTKKGKISARKLNRAHILLMSDEQATDIEIANSLHVGIATVGRIRKHFVEDGLDQALNEKPRPGATRKLDVKKEAFLIATACSSPPEGREHWTMQLLADKMVELKIVEELSDETVRRALKRGTLNRGLRRNGVFPTSARSSFGTWKTYSTFTPKQRTLIGQ